MDLRPADVEPVKSNTFRKLGRFPLWCGDFGLLRKLRESGGVLDGNVREDFAVQRDARRFEAVNQLSVRQAVQPRGRADALDPQASILALLVAAVAERIAVRAVGRLLCGLVELALGEKKALSPLKVLLAPSPALGAAFYACHGFTPSECSGGSLDPFFLQNYSFSKL